MTTIYRTHLNAPGIQPVKPAEFPCWLYEGGAMIPWMRYQYPMHDFSLKTHWSPDDEKPAGRMIPAVAEESDYVLITTQMLHEQTENLAQEIAKLRAELAEARKEIDRLRTGDNESNRAWVEAEIERMKTK